MYCNHCGKPLNEHEKWCPHCGKPTINIKNQSKIPIISLCLSGTGFLLSWLFMSLITEGLMLLGIILAAWHFNHTYKTDYPKGFFNMLRFAKIGLLSKNQADKISCATVIICPLVFIVYLVLAFLLGVVIGAAGGSV